jgi:outer membrane immunogenic protein
MKHILSAGLAVLALGAVPAGAADIRMPTKAPPAVAPAPVATWTGCYIGGNVGGGWADEKYSDPLVLPPDNFLGKHTATGVVGGGQVGCDFQVGNFVIGAQGMFDAADLTGEHLFGDIFHTHIPWFATATARLGYAFQPDFLVYVKGGAAWKRQEETIIDPVFLVVEGAASTDRTGGTVGAGFEWRFWNNLSFFAEYNYLAFGTKRITFAAFPEPGEVGPLPPFPLDIQENMSVVVAGFNWRFGPFH